MPDAPILCWFETRSWVTTAWDRPRLHERTAGNARRTCVGSASRSAGDQPRQTRLQPVFLLPTFWRHRYSQLTL